MILSISGIIFIFNQVLIIYNNICFVENLLIILIQEGSFFFLKHIQEGFLIILLRIKQNEIYLYISSASVNI